MTETSTLRLAEEFVQTPASLRRSRRLETLREELQRANRRAAGPFSHPFAISGTLSKLREQIRDVSRVADAVMLNAESATDQRVNELCGDIKSLLMTQQRWTDRLENQIWRLESQASLMRRLHQLLQERTPGNDRLWELCEVIARETQAIPTGLLLLPEPGHRVALSDDVVFSSASWSLEQARMAVFSAVTLLPNVRGAQIVAQTLHASSSQLLQCAERDYDTSVFAETLWTQRVEISNPNEELSRLIHQAGQVLTATNTLSLTAADMIVPPMIEEFYGGLSITIESGSIVDEDVAMAHSICQSLGLSTVNSRTTAAVSTSIDDGAIAMTHKLRWHDGTSTNRVEQTAPSRSGIRRPHFAPTGGKPATALTVFAREE